MLLRVKLLAAVAVAIIGTNAPAADTSMLLYRIPTAGAYGRPIWDDGHFGPIATFQTALRDRLQAMGTPASQLPVPDGKYGPRTSAAIHWLLTLPGFSDLAPAAGNDVGITAALWSRLLPGSLAPSVEERIDTLILTYEDTPFDSEAEWNFCQSMPSAQRRGPQSCRSNDPNSYITWGPRGATAGGGRDIQAVLIAADNRDPSLITGAFGPEEPAVRKFVRLGERRVAPVNLDTERLLCSVWMDPGRASAWAQGFKAFGTRPEVRKIYSDLYASPGFDGGKIAAFRQLYQSLGRQPTEVDLGFFTDRATHTGGVFASGHPMNSSAAIATVAARVRTMVTDPGAAPAWRIRRALSTILATSNQADDRNGRDVVFFVDGVGVGGLSETERTNWKHRGPRFASHIGLSDSRPAPPQAVSSASFPTRAQTFAELTQAESAQCPIRVLNWFNPGNGTSRTPPIQQ